MIFAALTENSSVITNDTQGPQKYPHQQGGLDILMFRRELESDLQETAAEIGLLILMPEKVCWFNLTGLITLVLLM